MNDKFKAFLIELAKYFKNNPKVAQSIADLINDDSLAAIIKKYSFTKSEIFKIAWDMRKANKTTFLTILSGEVTEKDF